MVKEVTDLWIPGYDPVCEADDGGHFSLPIFFFLFF